MTDKLKLEQTENLKEDDFKLKQLGNQFKTNVIFQSQKLTGRTREHEGLALVRIQNRTKDHQKLRSSAKSPQKETQKKKEDKQPVSENPVKSQPKDGLNTLTIADANRKPSQSV
ncbi:Hypothetical_protein [Hexamita inflata]|uniref:Hypothetical_protein n=1 Tax=Hexamita inflata TaxID=28002 RepID=A0AA86QB43_9EUKA|nr:Hypothetical protein HINF_LOCUS43534 [Hexamita inflata]